jgi:acyl carrier protein
METEMSEGQQLDNVTQQIRDFILGHFPAARQSPPGDADPLLESGIVDSLGILELVNFLTETFAISISDEDLQPDNFNSIRSLVAFVERKT